MEKEISIPATNDHLQALALFLQEDVSTISCNGTFAKVHCFRTATNDLYSVADVSAELDTNEVVLFNNNRWSIKKVDANSPYQRFKDSAVMRQLMLIKSDSSELVSIDQKENTAIFKTGVSLIKWSYSSHYPDELSSYYLRGAICEVSTGNQLR
ncbi:hypothetical protein [Vibrio sp. Hal054]|uniref:hypothetical protein n=1 Tax=Vibrio sp. Hal054 TaxID=3035158 RepID=UPI00301DEB7C